MTTKITIKQYLKEYVVGKFSDCNDKAPVKFPAHTDLYMVIWDSLVKRPVNCPLDTGNLEIVLPNRHVGKKPLYYNYIGTGSQKLIQKKIENMMWAECRDFIENNKQRYGISYLNSVNQFLSRYNIDSISQDALLKNFYRWRLKIRPRREKRQYCFKNKIE
ncbi:hypothetical protein EZS27_004055 [termite gut metagenome]|uniref:Uncharacterized protein n=1 Tax=termite gut metagenome TaxID=433724 RepID=A0A5J4STJ0_9ZZZZ